MRDWQRKSEKAKSDSKIYPPYESCSEDFGYGRRRKDCITIGVELSYLTEEEQYELHAVMDLEQCTPSLSQANRMKRMSQAGTLDMDEMYSILEQEKPNQREQIKIRADTLADYFPKDFTPKQKVELIESLVKEWHEKQMVQTKPSVQQKLKKKSMER